MASVIDIVPFPAGTLSKPLTAAIVTVLAAGLALYIIGQLVREYILVPKFTIMRDLDALGTERPDGKHKGRAIVCGGSIAGLYAAAVCSFHFDTVTIIEAEACVNENNTDIPTKVEVRDNGDGPGRAVPARSRIPQWLALHAFLPPNTLAIQRMFPQYQKELDPHGIQPCPHSSSSQMSGIAIKDPYNLADPEAPKIFPMSRAAFETFLRRLVVKYRRNVHIVNGTVDSFVRSPSDDLTLEGVVVRDPQGQKVTETADFIVDASGPARLSYNKLLKHQSATLPAHREYDASASYSQTAFNLPENIRSQVETLFPDSNIVNGVPRGNVWCNMADWTDGEKKILYIHYYERSQLIITVGEWGGQGRPYTISELRSTFKMAIDVKGAGHAWIWKLFDLLEDNEEECKPWIYNAKTTRMYNTSFHEAGGMPRNWIAIGDSIMKLNPVYAQGCMKAVIDCVTLDRHLRAIPSSVAPQNFPTDFAKTYYQARRPRVEFLWDCTKSLDYAFDTTIPCKGETLETGSFARTAGRYSILASRKSTEVSKAFYLSQCGLVPVTDCLAPSVLLPIARAYLTA